MTYGMLIDLKKCIGCHACAVACKEAHGTPPKVTRAHVEIEYVGNYPDVRMTAYPMLCMHCENAPCVEVCPTGASFKREDGIVAINKDECIGCKSCMSACPYGARYYREDENGYFGETLNEYEEVMYPTIPKGTVDKCTFCADRIDAGDGAFRLVLPLVPLALAYSENLTIFAPRPRQPRASSYCPRRARTRRCGICRRR